MSTEPTGKVFLAIPAMNESTYLPAMLQSVVVQSRKPDKVFICVNQPDVWWAASEEKRSVCHDNRKTLEWLHGFHDLDVEVIDRSSPGKGWQGKQSGAGWARKVLMDAINLVSADEDIMVSMDADTHYEPDYLDQVRRSFAGNPRAVALCAPFYHPLGASDSENRALLRYELYMRHYFLNLAEINSPYAFIALGSAIALPVRAYRKIRGITPFKAGEDFYFMQKLRKTGGILNYCASVVNPSPRVSSRAGFGTGPAIGKGLAESWRAYPFFPAASFQSISETYGLFPTLYERHVPTPMDDFLEAHFGTCRIWDPLRENFRSRLHFVRACHEKMDGLRLLQYLKFSRHHDQGQPADDGILASFVKDRIPKRLLKELSVDPCRISFETTSLADLNALRDILFRHELDVRKEMPCRRI